MNSKYPFTYITIMLAVQVTKLVILQIIRVIVSLASHYWKAGRCWREATVKMIWDIACIIQVSSVNNIICKNHQGMIIRADLVIEV